MSQSIFGTFPVVYPPAARYFDVEAECALKDARCDGSVKVHAYFYFEGPAILDLQDNLIAVPPSAAELMLADGLDYIELCALHHGEWWQQQRDEYRERAAR